MDWLQQGLIILRIHRLHDRMILQHSQVVPYSGITSTNGSTWLTLASRHYAITSSVA